MRAGLTLVEVLVVMAILIVLAAIVVPVTIRVKANSLRGTCTANLRQIGMSLDLYASDFGTRPTDVRPLAATVDDRRILLCPADRVGGFVRAFERCQGNDFPVALSYDNNLDWGLLLEKLEAIDPNYGVFACRLHGHRTKFADGATNSCSKYEFAFEGPFLRLRRDGSVQAAHFRFKYKTLPGSAAPGPMFSYWWLWTDAPVSDAPAP